MRDKLAGSKWVANTSGYQKLALSLLLAALAFIATMFLHLGTTVRIMVAWDIFTLSLIGLSWLLFITTTAKEQHEVVRKQDDGLKVIFAIVLTSVCVSLLGTLLLIVKTTESSADKDIRTIVTLSAVALSWVLLHTIFTIRYAHLYHDHNKLNTGTEVGGIDFPDSEQPDYLDFAYFSFVIGMTFQVSDVSVSSRMVRRYVLMHSLISFVFNTIIVALTINTIANISN